MEKIFFGRWLYFSRIFKKKEYPIQRIAVEINGNIIPKSKYDTTILKDNDIIEIVSFVGGG